MKKVYTVLAALMAILTVEIAFAKTTRDRLNFANRQVEARRYEQAIRTTRPMLDGLLLDTVEEIILAHRILGVSYCETGDQPNAIKHFKTLLTFSPTEEIKDLVRSKPCAKMYADLKAGKSHIAVPNAPPIERSIEERTTMGTGVERKAPSPGTWKRFVPYGFGQFANRQNGKGMAFLSTEVAATGLAVTSYILFRSERNSDGTFSNPGKASTYRTMYWSTFAAGVAIGAYGIVDALLVHRKYTSRKQATKEKKFSFNGISFAMKF